MAFESDSQDDTQNLPTEIDANGPLDIHRRDVRTGEVGRTFDYGEGRVFPCESCGADCEGAVPLARECEAPTQNG